jgi:hypothetical protein
VNGRLERWYRRLLVAYPAGHRRRYGQEMLDVLLADANERGQRRPSLRESADLLSGGLRIRARRLTPSFRTPPWRDALAVVSLVGPLIFLAISTMLLNNVVEELIAVGQGRFSLGQAAPDAARLFAWPVALTLAFWGRRLPARCARLAGAMLAIDLIYQTCLSVERGGFEEIAIDSGLVMLYLLSALALAAPPGPRRGLAVLGRGSGGLIVVASAIGLFGDLWWLSWGVALAVLLVGLRRPSGRRAAALLVAPLLSVLVLLSTAHVPDHTPAMRLFLVTAAFVAPLIIGGSLSLTLAIDRSRTPS